MASKSEGHVNIDIGGIGRDQQGIIAGRDVKNATIHVAGQPIAVDKQPTLDEFKQLLAEVQREIAELLVQQKTLADVDPSAPFTAQGAEQSINSVVGMVQSDMEVEEAESVKQRLSTAENLLTGILDSAKNVAKKTNEVAEAVMPIVEKLEPLVQKLGVAAIWAARLWLLA